MGATFPILIMSQFILTAEEMNIIQSLRNQKAKNESNVNANGTDNNNQVIVSEDKPKKNRQMPAVYMIAKMAMKYYKESPKEYQNTTGKKFAVERAIARDKKERFGDAARFWDAVYEEGLLLDRASDLKEYCDKQGLDYEAVKQHMVLEGKGFIKDIVLNGIRGKETLIDKFGEFLYVAPKNRAEESMNESVSITQQDGNYE